MRWIDIPPVWLLGFLLFARASRDLLPGTAAPSTLARGLGGCLVVGGLLLMALALRELIRHKTTPVPGEEPTALVTSGVFQFSRNPIYLGDALVLLGAIFWWTAWPALVLVPGFMAVITIRFILPEEYRLRARFGADYSDWAERTRRWI